MCVICHMSCVMSRVMCHMSCVVSCVICLILECLDVMEYHWKVHVNNDALSAALYFSSMDGSLPTSSVSEWIIEWGSQYIQQYKLSTAITIEQVQSNIQQQITQFHRQTGPFTSRDKNVHDYNKQTPHVTFGCCLLLTTMWSLCILLLHYYPFVLRRPQ